MHIKKIADFSADARISRDFSDMADAAQAVGDRAIAEHCIELLYQFFDERAAGAMPVAAMSIPEAALSRRY